MAGSFQDDERENAMRLLFELYKGENEGRSGIDAFLKIDGQQIPFELKTSSKGSVTTVRDFGPDHVEKWQDKHWLFGFFIGGSEYYMYGSPAMMEPWIQEKSAYIQPDFQLANLVSNKITLQDMYQLVGKKKVYTYDNARYIQKRQYNQAKYHGLQDLDSGYSPRRMLEIVKDRVRYIMERGSTLNNPHIPFSYFEDWEKITMNHAQRLRVLVRNYLDSQGA